MNLQCDETCVGERVIRARRDPTLLDDSRVLENLLKLEDRYLVSTNYFDHVQEDVKPYMREMVATWMMQVCEEQRCEEDVFPLSMNYLDRFLSVQAIRRTQLQSLGAACMLLASKVKETLPLTTEKLVIYTDHSVKQEELLRFELMLLMRLKWDILAVTPIDFVDQIMHHIGLNVDVSELVRRHANTFIHLCCTDHKFSVYTPSMIAAGSVGAAISGLQHMSGSSSSSRHRLLAQLQAVINVDTDILRNCLEQVEEALRSSFHSSSHPNGKYAEPAGGVQDCGVEGGLGVNRAADPQLHAAGTDCREVGNTPTDVDMVF